MTKKRIEAASNQAVSYRNYRRARDRALTRLAQAYPDEYKEYLEEEKAADEQEGKKWIDITGRTAAPSRRAVGRTVKPKARAKTGGHSRKKTSNDGRKK